MSQRPDQLKLSIGTNDAERRKYALNHYVADRLITGRNNLPSISELVCRLADALDFDYPQAAMYLDDLMALAGTAHVVEAEEAQNEHTQTSKTAKSSG
ncbi:MAG: hypothetical protein H6658_02130 [Ardenticatenaceae bacterium]|nr:hypothetical protein [Ardenticatenaceae bacterium]